MCGIKAVSWLALDARRRELEEWLDDADCNHRKYQERCRDYAEVLAEMEERKKEAVPEGDEEC
jgi:F0F1-type ATP synthase membrane subunit b/b'